MSEFKEAKNCLRDINKGLEVAGVEGDQPTIRFSGRPDFRVIEFDPLAYEEYGRLFGRGPKLYGRFALRQLLWEETKFNGSKFISGIDLVFEAGELFYGTSVGKNAGIINDIANEVVPELGINIYIQEYDPLSC
ncbi:MAG: hypothetical protein AAB914_02770 [Patescibacteria group bacterium]